MRDIRIERWANLLVHYSLQTQPNDYAVLVGDVDAAPLLEACYEAFIKAGAHAEAFVVPSDWAEIFYAYASDKQLAATPPAMLHAVQKCQRYLRIASDPNAKLLANVNPAKQTLASKARKPILEALLDRAAKNEMRWALTHFPNAAAAQEADMGTREYEEFVLSLGHLNAEDPVAEWQKIEKEQQKLVDYLNTKKALHFQNPQGTDLHVDISGMKWVNCCGKINFPDGEVYTGPNLSAANGGVNGVARYSFPTVYRNVEVHDIELRFENGAVVEANASKGEPFLREMIAQDAGAKFVGEIAIGTNPHVKRITKNILFDEKFGGTFHLALGKGYPQTGNTNESALHWDMIFDLREGGSITADGELLLKSGQLQTSLFS